MTAIRLTKHVALGNDFLVAIEPAAPIGPAEAIAWCDRRAGIGADGLITLVPHPDPAHPDRWVMVLLNSDGSRAEISGNGARCVGQALARHVGVRPPVRLEVETDAGLRGIELVSVDGDEMSVRVDMGPVRPGPRDSSAWSDLGVVVERQVGLDIGNPHLVALVDDPDRYDLAVIGPAIESAYPEGVNVHLIRVTSDHSLDLRVWERGAGITLACGSGACAAAAAAARWGLTGRIVDVSMPGGVATVDSTDDGDLRLTGPTRFIASITIEAGPVAADHATRDTPQPIPTEV